MREDADVEVRAEQVLVAQPQHTAKEVEELRAQVAALTAKTAELQAELRHQSIRAPRHKICYWCEQPGHFQQDCAERRQYVQRQQGPRASFNPSRPQPRFYAPRHSAGPFSIPPGKLEVPVVRSQTMEDMNPVGMIGRCPTVDTVINGRKVRGLVDTGSEVTTVTERWVAENLQNSDLLPMTQVTLKAANGLEIPYSGIVIEDLELLGQKCEGVPVLVVKDFSQWPLNQEEEEWCASTGGDEWVR